MNSNHNDKLPLVRVKNTEFIKPKCLEFENPLAGSNLLKR